MISTPSNASSVVLRHRFGYLGREVDSQQRWPNNVFSSLVRCLVTIQTLSVFLKEKDCLTLLVMKFEGVHAAEGGWGGLSDTYSIVSPLLYTPVYQTR